MKDYSTPLCPNGCASDHAHHTAADVVEMIVRPPNRFNAAQAGEHVKIDRAELRVPAVREALWTAEEARAATEAAQAKAEEARAATVKPKGIGATIQEQLEAAWNRGRTRPAHAPAER